MKAVELLHFDDFPAIREIMERMQKECEPDMVFDEEEVYANMHMCVADTARENLNAWYVLRDGEVIGFGVGRMSKMLFSKMKIASMLFWYVVPEARKSRAAFELLHNFENWATLGGAWRIEVGAARLGVGGVDHINKMFERRGFNRYGELFFRPTSTEGLT